MQRARPSRRRRCRPASSCRARAVRRTAGGRRPGRAAGPPRGRSPRCSFSSRWPTNSASGRGRSPASTTSSTSSLTPGRGTRHARRGPEQLEGVAQQRRRVAVAGQLAQRLADLVGAVAEPGQRLAHVADRRAAGAAAGADRRRAPAPTAGLAARRAAARPSSCRRRARASSAPTSPLATMSTRAAGGWVARIAIASAGPTPWVAISVLNVARSSRARNP